MSSYPSSEECYRIMRQEGLPPVVVRHVCVVNLVAMAIARRCGADLGLVNAASLLHDIGRSRTHGLDHVAESVNIARAHDLPEDLVLCIGRHISSGFTADEARELGLPSGDYMPVTLEDKVGEMTQFAIEVIFADNLVSDRTVKTVAQAAERMRRKGFEMSAERMLAIGGELESMCGTDLDSLLEEAKVLEAAVRDCEKRATASH